MKTIVLRDAHQAQLEQLTGCKYATLKMLTVKLKAQMMGGRGRPFAHSVFVMLCLSLMKLRCNLTVRSMEALTGVDAVTVSRCVNRITATLRLLPLAGKTKGQLVVDSTSCRVSTTNVSAYSGHKHQRCAKFQLISRVDGQIVAVSPTHVGSVHDKTIWNQELAGLKHLFDQLVLADKAYAGAAGENVHLLRPIKRGEKAYKEDPDKAKAFNRSLSKVRVGVEHVFARLKTWRVFAGLFPFKWNRLGEFARAIAVVHNMNREIMGTAA